MRRASSDSKEVRSFSGQSNAINRQRQQGTEQILWYLPPEEDRSGYVCPGQISGSTFNDDDDDDDDDDDNLFMDRFIRPYKGNF